MDESLKKQAYLEGMKLKKAGHDNETIFARLDKLGIPEELAKQVVINMAIEQKKGIIKEQTPLLNIALLRIGAGVFLAIASAVLVPGVIILPIGLIVCGITFAFMAKSKMKESSRPEYTSHKQPEEYYITTITPETITVSHPKWGTTFVHWNDITKIYLLNTDEGPWLPDIWLCLEGGENKCLSPHGSTGFEELYKIVSKYDGFSFENFAASMTCTNNAVFALWSK